MQGSNRSQSGLSIVEALVTMVILMIVLGGVYQIFQSNSLTYRMQEGLSRLQENGRFAMDFLVNDVRMAGYRGCSNYGEMTSTLKTDNLHESAQWMYEFDVGIIGYDDVPSNFTELGTLNVVPGTDVIVIRRHVGESVGILRNNSSAQLFAEITSEEEKACSNETDRISGICEGDILLVSDCVKSRVFQAGNIQIASQELNITHPSSGNPGNDPSSWGGQSGTAEERFGNDSEIVKISSVAFYVRLNPSGQPALYRKEGNASPQELVEGVESMQVLYGEDATGDYNVDTYVDATAVGDWDRVRSVRIGLLLRTPEDIRGMEPDTAVYDVLGIMVGPANDMRMRRVFTATIGLRNRLR